MTTEKHYSLFMLLYLMWQSLFVHLLNLLWMHTDVLQISVETFIFYEGVFVNILKWQVLKSRIKEWNSDLNTAQRAAQ